MVILWKLDIEDAFYFMSEIPEPFFFCFRSSFCLLSKNWPLWVSLFCNQGAIHTNNWLLYWRKTTTTKPNEIELIKNPEQITNDLNKNKADLCDIIFKKWSKKLLGLNFRIPRNSGPPHLHVSGGFEDRGITQ